MTKEKETSDLIGQRKLRLEKVAKLRELGINPYPPKSFRNSHIKDINEHSENIMDSDVVVSGRLMSLREHGHLIFADLRDQSGNIQLYIKEDTLLPTNDNVILSENFKAKTLGFSDLKLLDVGDFVEAYGTVTKTKTGQLSILVKTIRVLTKSIRPLPKEIEDKEERYRRRYLDMTLHPEVRERFIRRSKFWNAIREFLDKNGFIEINTPVLEHVTGGADAKPFVTYYDALDQNFYLRISHELPLKRLLGAGFEKVYDIGPRFRNEGFSDEHLPEHIAMEWYWAYADAKDGMEFTKEMYRYVMQVVYGTLKFNMKGFEIDLSKEWEPIDFVAIIKDRFNVDIFNDSVESMNEILKQNGVDLGDDINRNRVVDNLWKSIRKTIAGPAFLTGVPKFLSPLAKSKTENPEITERFHPVIAGSELANAFGELNDPVDQLERFLEQQGLRDSGDAEAHMLDIDYVEMLEYGMPPAVGFGLSERVFWFFENVSAKEGVPFPQLKSRTDDITKKVYPEVFDLSLKDNLPSNVKTQPQDFSNRIAIVVNSELPNWQITNSVAHISAYIGHKLEKKFDTGEYFVTKDAKNHPRNTQYPIVVLSANPGQMNNLMQKVRESGVLYHGFIKEMIETTNDTEITEILSNKTDDQIEYLGIGFYGDNDTLKKLTNKFSLLK